MRLFRIRLIGLGAAVLGAVAMALAVPAPASAGISQYHETFEARQPPGWYTYGNAGFDHNRGLAYRGVGNAWVRNWTGWNAVNTVVSVPMFSECVATAQLRTSEWLTDGYMTVRSWTGQPGGILGEVRVVDHGNPALRPYYFEYSFSFYSGRNSSVLFYVGLWGNGRDTWIQADEVVVTCFT